MDSLSLLIRYGTVSNQEILNWQFLFFDIILIVLAFTGPINVTLHLYLTITLKHFDKLLTFYFMSK